MEQIKEKEHMDYAITALLLVPLVITHAMAYENGRQSVFKKLETKWQEELQK